MSAIAPRLVPAASGILQYASGFAIGAVLGTATYFYQTRETVVLGEDTDGLNTRFRWVSGPQNLAKEASGNAEKAHH